jgi:hypothetical protein
MTVQLKTIPREEERSPKQDPKMPREQPELQTAGGAEML